MADKWNSKKYKQCAAKHYNACQYIVNKYKSLPKSYKNDLISSLYYLGGYVIECSFKCIYLENNHDRERFYSKEELMQMCLLTHKLKPLLLQVQDSSGVELPSWDKLSKFTQEWSENVRYDYSLVRKKHKLILEDFWGDVQNIYNLLRCNY